MANIRIPFLVQRRGRWFWQPSAALAKAGWKSKPLGDVEALAINAAKDLNAAVEAWKKGGSLGTPETPALPAPVRAANVNKGMTVADLIDHYKQAGWPRLSQRKASNADAKFISVNSRRAYRWAFGRVEQHFGDVPLHLITPPNVMDFRDAMLAAPDAGHDIARYTLKIMRGLFTYAIRAGLDSRLVNPVANFGLAAPAPRHQIWDRDNSGADFRAFAAAAEATGWPELALAVELFLELGQRPCDMVSLGADKWKPIEGLTADQQAALANHDGPNAGQVMGFLFRQKKTGAWVGIPIAGELRRKIEAQIERNRRRDVPCLQLLVNEHTGRPWTPTTLRGRFHACRAHIVEKLGMVHFAELQIRDLRRTAVVKMGELGLEPQSIAAITGHSLATVDEILEVYMPRTTRMAAVAQLARLEFARRQPAAVA